MVGCVLSQLKTSDLSILSCEKGHGLRPRPKNAEPPKLYPIHKRLIKRNKNVYRVN